MAVSIKMCLYKIYNPERVYCIEMRGLSWLWLNGSWIYNYLCNQLPSPLIVVGSNPAHGEVHSIQIYVIKFVTDFRQIGGFLRVLQFPPPIQYDRHEITDILLKVVLNTITLTTLVL